MLKKLLFATLVLASAHTASAQFSEVSHIDDLALIYIGSQHRPDWNKELFTPYVYHTYPDGSQSWMFDGFLMIEFLAYNDNGDPISFGETSSSVGGSKKADWERLLAAQLGTNSGLGCRALDNLIGEMIPKLGAPGHKHKVVFTLPVAEIKSDKWGFANGEELIFTNYEHRVKGMKWYADYLVEEWNKAGFKNLELDGVYWTSENISGANKTMALTINEYYHNKGLNVYWIPYLLRDPSTLDLLPTQSADAWQDIKVDVCYVQPNYYFQATRPAKYLSQSIDYAWNHDGVGLEVEFEGYNFSWSFNQVTKIGTRVKSTPANCGLYDISPTYHQRLIDYIDYFEAESVFDFMPVSYYSGFQAIYDFEKSGNPHDKEIINRIASIINSRHVITGWDTEPTGAVKDVVVDSRLLAYGLKGEIYIANEVAANVSVFSIDGKLLYGSKSPAVASENCHYGFTVPCPPGIYVVKAGPQSVKVTVQ